MPTTPLVGGAAFQLILPNYARSLCTSVQEWHGDAGLLSCGQFVHGVSLMDMWCEPAPGASASRHRVLALWTDPKYCRNDAATPGVTCHWKTRVVSMT